MLKVFLVISFLLSPSAFAEMREKTPWEKAADQISDYTLWTLVAGSTLGMPTWEQRGYSVLNHGINFGVNWLFKKLIKGPRPDDPEDLMGMPSGHAQLSAGSAGRLCKAYAKTKGALCWVGVGLGLTAGELRVQAGRHSREQVAVGTVLGGGIGYFVGVQGEF